MKYKNIFIATTDTVVGIGGPMNEKVRKEIFELKKRPQDKKLLIMVADIETARSFKGWNENAEKISSKEWPGSTTIILDEVGLRIPNNKELIKLIKEIGPIYMTSANISGNDTLDFENAKKAFPEIKKHYNFGVGSNKPSKIIKASNMEILR